MPTEFGPIRSGSVTEPTGRGESHDTGILDAVVTDILGGLARFEKDLFFLGVQRLREVADHLNTNTAYLSRVINTHKGISFTTYLNGLKIEHAIAHLPLDKHLYGFTIRAISQEYGFSNPEKFSRLFKERTGAYPSEYLRNQIEDPEPDISGDP